MPNLKCYESFLCKFAFRWISYAIFFHFFSHEESCEYRFVECPVLTCRWKFPMQRGITKHFQVVHPKRELSSWKDQVKFEGSLSKLLDHLLVMTVQEKDCFPHFTRKDNSLLVWIIMLANTEETLPYRLSLTFKTGKNRSLSQLMSCSYVCTNNVDFRPWYCHIQW